MITKKVGNWFKTSPSRNAIVAFLGVVIVNSILQKNFFAPEILLSNLSMFLPMILLTIGQAVVLISGEIDLSVGSGAALVNVVVTTILRDNPDAIFSAVLAAICVGLLIGGVNSFVVAITRLPAIVATFATAAIFYGTALKVLPTPTSIDQKLSTYYSSGLVFGFIPLPIAILVGVLFIWWFLGRFRFRRYIYAVGGNEASASANAINTVLTKSIAFIICGILVAFAGFVITMQYASGDANNGKIFALSSIAAAVIGGVSLQGGKGAIGGAVLGSIILSLIANIIFYARLASLYQELIKGIIVITAIGLSIYTNYRNERKSLIIN